MTSENLPGPIQKIYAFLKTGLGVAVTIVAIVTGTVAGFNKYYDARKVFEEKLEAIGDVEEQIIALRGDLERERDARAFGAEERSLLSTTIAAVEARVGALEAANMQRQKPSMRFIRFAPHSIEPSRPGDVTEVLWHFIVDFPCGRPKVIPQMRDAGQYEHDMKTVGFNGTASEVGKELEIRYRVRTPDDVTTGMGKHWVLIEYASGGCPTVRSPEIDFEILPPSKGDLGAVATFPE